MTSVVTGDTQIRHTRNNMQEPKITMHQSRRRNTRNGRHSKANRLSGTTHKISIYFEYIFPSRCIHATIDPTQIDTCTPPHPVLLHLHWLSYLTSSRLWVLKPYTEGAEGGRTQVPKRVGIVWADGARDFAAGGRGEAQEVQGGNAA